MCVCVQDNSLLRVQTSERGMLLKEKSKSDNNLGSEAAINIAILADFLIRKLIHLMTVIS